MKITLDDFRAAQSLIVRRSHELASENHISLSQATKLAEGELASALSMEPQDLSSQMAYQRQSFKKVHHKAEAKPVKAEVKPIKTQVKIKHEKSKMDAVDVAGLILVAKMVFNMSADLLDRIEKITQE